MRTLALAIHAAGLAAALLNFSATGVASTRLLREGSTEDNVPCEFYHCRPRSMSATTADCRLWCNSGSDSNSDDCAKYCKCPSDPIKGGGVFCKGVCLTTLRCVTDRTPRCTARGSLQCQQA
jgi:hypothetical protein